MSTQRELHDSGRCNFDTCGFCWQEHEELALWGMEEDAGVLGVGPNSAAITDESDDFCPHDRWGEDTGRAVLDAFYGNATEEQES